MKKVLTSCHFCRYILKVLLVLLPIKCNTSGLIGMLTELSGSISEELIGHFVLLT